MRETFDVAGITTVSSVYPSAVAAGELIFVSGQVSFDDDGAVIHGGDVTAQTAQCISRLADVLVGVGSVLADVVQATVYLADAAYADDFNREWSPLVCRHQAGACHSCRAIAGSATAGRDFGHRSSRKWRCPMKIAIIGAGVVGGRVSLLVGAAWT